MFKAIKRSPNKLERWWGWVKGNPQVLFWLVCAFAGWYLGMKGYGMMLYFRLAGINPEEWTPTLKLAARKDPQIGSQVNLSGLIDWQGRPLKLPVSNKLTGLLFIRGIEYEIAPFKTFYQIHKDKMQLVVVLVGQPTVDTASMISALPQVIWARDPQLTVYERLNALYMPRFYLIAPDGTLLYLSPLVGYLWDIDRWQQELEYISRRLIRR